MSKSANQWIDDASKQPVPRSLFSDFWFERELTFLFSDTNAGKSVLAVQIAESIASGSRIDGFEMDAASASVLYFDLELSAKQFECRYSQDYRDHYRFSPRFIRSEICPSDDFFEVDDHEEFFLEQVDAEILRHGVSRVILDNITFVSNETEKSKSALRIMKGLKQLKDKHEISILALGHTPKRPLDQPITQNHLAGSKMLMNFADAAFAIGKSSEDSDVRYLKQIKVRSAPERFGSNNVIACRIAKPDNFLRFEYLRTGPEREHLRASAETGQDERDDEIRKLSEAEPNLTQRELAERVGTSAATVNRVLKSLRR